ncbi:MAG: DDE-type integrase/transposase/recombinase [Candidatus Bathyarchaeia archaeon]|jgi:transposase-like protein
MQTAVLSREEKGRLIAEKPNQIQQIDERFYKVNSQSREITYDVVRRENGSWICSCLDFHYRASELHQIIRCKHIIACQLREQLREKVRENVVIQPVEITACIYCHSDKSLKRFGIRHNKCGEIQRFLCVACDRTFSVNLGFERMKHSPQAVTTAMQMYFSGESLRNTAKTLRLLGVHVCHRTVFNWIEKYTALMEKYLDKITPQVSDTWRADELFLKVKGNMKYLYALMDDQTRFWIAQEVADTKFTADLRPLFQQGKEIAEKSPKTLITDGAPNFHEAYLREFYTKRLETRTEHIQEIRMAGKVHNNKMERMNGELRDRERVMRTLEKTDTPILSGMQIFHNYIRPHEALKGKTPADVAGIKIEGENKWLTIIQNASRKVAKS